MKKQSEHTMDDRLFRNLDSFQSINARKDWQAVSDQIGFNRKRRLNRTWWAAASIILLLGMGFLGKQLVLSSPALVIVSTEDFKKDIVLPDGSHLSLNEYSELHHPEKFRKKQREVSLFGEGYFEVVSDPSRPFFVHVAEKANVEVLGTSFNITSYEDNEVIIVQVVEGKVAFQIPGNPDKREILVKDDQAVLKDGTILKTEKRDKNFLSWKTGILYFDQTPIGKVVEELSDFYNRKIVILDPTINSLTFTSTIDNQELDSVLEELRIILGLSHTTEKNEITILMAN